MKIALLTLGTRGDVQPFAIIGKALKSRGHEITLVTAKNFSGFVESYGLRFIPIDADFQAILNSEEGKKMMSNPFSARKHLNRLIYPMIEDALNTFYKVSAGSDCVLFHVKAMAEYFAEKCNAKFIRMNLVPAMEPTREFVNPVFSALHLPSIFNRFSYKLTDLGLKMMSKPVNAFRRQVGIVGKYRKPLLPSIYGISPLFIPRPKDYPAASYFTGFWAEESEELLDPEVISFIDGGEPPLLLTLGSMPFESRFNLSQALDRMTKELHTRVIVIRGWGLKDTIGPEENPNIKYIPSAPYDKLFPLVKAVIHHGGIGTIAACLKAGKPFLTCPVLYPLGDQHFWGMNAFRKGLGLKPIPLKKMTEERLLASVKELLANKSLYENCKQIMQKLKYEDGVANAIGLIERF